MNSEKIISPSNFSDKLLSIKQLDDIVDKNSISNIEFDNLIHKVCCQIDSECDNTNISTLQAYIDLDEFFTSYGDSEAMMSTLEASWCGYFDQDKKLCEDWFILTLNRLMNENKIIFVYLDLHYYFVTKKEQPKYWERGDHERVSHSTAMIFYPNNSRSYDHSEISGNYNLYYFNPHGSDQLSETCYSLYITKKRKKDIELPIHMDGFIIQSFVEMFNSTIYDYLEEGEKHNRINYTLSKRHNYYGTNLQSIDDWGVCYIFPFVLWYELKVSFIETTKLMQDSLINTRGNNKTVRRFTSYQTYMRNNNMEQIVFLCLSKYIPEIREMYLKYKLNPYKNSMVSKRLVSKKLLHPYSEVFESENVFYENLEAVLRYKGSSIIHTIYSQFVNYLIQPELLQCCREF
tara:strand:- start:66 stop:1274 length:1209 start_codon:yes stop_codon:yes gene_type:complete